MVGITAGSIIYFGQGLINAPRGQRLVMGFLSIRNRAPVLGGTIALWSGSFAGTSGYLKYKRQTEDEWNDTIGGGLTAFLINLRSGGLYFAANQGLQMAVLFYFIEKAFHKKKTE
jgi:import inner membrane translocase subunit TIM17